MPAVFQSLFAAIVEAHAALRPAVDVTPLLASPALSEAFGCEVWLKHEHRQASGSFKLRGASNRLRLLGAEARVRGVFTASTGNHGAAVALAGRRLQVPVTVYVAKDAVEAKVARIRALGARTVVVDGAAIDAELQARAEADAQGLAYVSPYNDFDVVAGQGTLGVELAEQAPDLDAVFIAVGGGGLIGGTGTALRRVAPRVRVAGAWAANSAAMLRSLEAGRIVDADERPTWSDGTAGAIEPGALTFDLCRAVVDDTVEVDEAAITTAMRRLHEAEGLRVEGAAGVALAGLWQRRAAYAGRKVAVVLCGGNIDPAKFDDAIAGRPSA